MILYKLTDENDQTYGKMQWGKGVTHRATGKGWNLCTNDLIHAYKHPLLAAFFNSIHAGYINPHLWVCKVTDKCKIIDDGTKVGVKSLTTIKQMELPKITAEQRIEVAIRSTLLVYQEQPFVEWANNWLNGNNRDMPIDDILATIGNYYYINGIFPASAAYYAIRATADSYINPIAEKTAISVNCVIHSSKDKVDSLGIIRSVMGLEKL